MTTGAPRGFDHAIARLLDGRGAVGQVPRGKTLYLDMAGSKTKRYERGTRVNTLSEEVRGQRKTADCIEH